MRALMKLIMNKPRRHSRSARRVKSPATTILDSHPQVCQITDLSHDGRGVGRLAGKTCFVDGALPGETVEMRVWRHHRNYDEARLSKVLQPSLHRIAPACRHFSQCGGCSLQHFHPERQIDHKAEQLATSFERRGMLAKRWLPTLTAASFGYRRRVRLAVQRGRDQRWELGFRNAGSLRIEPLSECLTMVPALAFWLPLLPSWLADHCGQFTIKQIELVAGDQGVAIAVEANRRPSTAELLQMRIALDEMSPTPEALSPVQAPQLWWKTPDTSTFSCLDAEREPLWAAITDRLSTAVEPGQFMQINGAINRQMIAQVLSLVEPVTEGVAIDLYCGAGNFTLPLAEHYRRVIGIEGLSDLVERGRRNARHNGLTNVDFMVADLAALKRPLDCNNGIQLVILDPPRAGAAGVMQWIIDSGAKQIIYVSCHPSTLLRDAEILSKGGFKLDALGAMDMFPQTAHVEAMALFERVGVK